MRKMPHAYVEVSTEMLREALRMPDSMVVIGAELTSAVGVVRLTVDDPGLDYVAEGEALPRLTPVFVSEDGVESARWTP